MTDPIQAKIRAWAPHDLDRIEDIRAAAFAPVFRSFRAIVGDALAEPLFGDANDMQKQYLVELCRSLRSHDLFVAEVAGQVVGFMHTVLDAKHQIGEIGLNAVDPTFANKGIGTSMYRFAIARFRSEGMKAAKVSAGGDPSHEPARKAYAKAGFDISLPSTTFFQTL